MLGVKGLVFVLGILKIVFLAVFSTLGLTIMGVAAIIIGVGMTIYEIYSKWGTLIEGLKYMWSELGKIWGQLGFIWDDFIDGIVDKLNIAIGKIKEFIEYLAKTPLGKFLSKFTGSVGTVMSTETYNKDNGGSSGPKAQSVNVNGQINVGVNGGKVESSSLQTDTGGNLGFNNPAYDIMQ